jgi:histone demethylase JARID1
MSYTYFYTRIHDQVASFGICKIVPPSEWNPPCQITFENSKKFPTKRQQINKLQEGQGFEDGKRYNLSEYKAMADEFFRKWCLDNHPDKINANNHIKIDMDDLARDYWGMVETQSRDAEVDYANDIETSTYNSGFLKKVKTNEVKLEDNRSSSDNDVIVFDDEYYAESPWNLNNLPTAKGSVLQYLRTPINGINVPWLYIGMLFATFCWHNEDNYLYSINYNHFGAVKQWYGVPGSSAEQFEKVSRNFLLGLFRESPDLLQHMTTQISPSLLYANEVPVYQMTQEAKTFIVTFPKAFHAGFSYGVRNRSSIMNNNHHL